MKSLRAFAIAAAVIGGVAAGSAAEAPTAEAEFKCDDDKTIKAVFYPESVDLTLSDGRTLDLPQAMSGSGARYANADESVVFWNKGNTAFITEGSDDTQTYANCVSASQ